jgi:hypothetical protein
MGHGSRHAIDQIGPAHTTSKRLLIIILCAGNRRRLDGREAA